MDILIKIAAICVAAAVFSAAIKKDDPAMALMTGLAAACVIAYMTLSAATEVFDFMAELSELAGVSSAVIAIVLKTVGIAVISKIASDVCKEAGMVSASTMSELAGVCAALYIALPLMKTALEMIAEVI